jgi:sugar/nucleoside kinase (ribokinase family)
MSVLCSGSFVADILVPDLPYIGPPGSLTYAPSGIKLSPGGHSGNVAIDLAQLGVKDVHAAGSIGKDMMGGFLVEQLNAAGVKVHSEVHENTTTAKNIALLVRDEDRRFIAELTANSKLTPRFLMDAMTSVKPKVYYQGTLGGLPFIEQELEEVLRHAKSLGAFTFLDVIMPSNGWDYLPSSLVETDLLHCNLDEGKSLTGLENPVDMAGYLLDHGVKGVIITDGGNGLTAGTKEYLVDMPSYPVTQLDPTGAGDALCAGIIQHIHSIQVSNVFEEKNFIESLLLGQATGAACVTGIGATTNVKPDKVKEILQSKGEILSKTRTTKR